MLRPRWHKLWRDLWGNKTRTILVALSIAIGLFAIGLVAGSQAILSHDLSGSYEAITPASATLVTDAFDDELVQVVERMPEVSLAEGGRRVTARLSTGPNMWRPLRLLAISDYADMRINKLHPMSGAWPPPKHDMLLERSALSLIHADVGSQVMIELPDGTQRNLHIAGLVHDLSQPAAFLTNAANGYITFDTLEWLGEPRTYNELYVVIKGDAHTKADAERIIARVRDKVEKSGRTVYQTTVPQPHEHPLGSMIQALVVILGMLGALSLFLSVFLVLNTIAALLMQQVRQIGVMKAVGARSKQIAGMYICTVLIYGLLALVVAVPLGIFGTRVVTAYIASLLNFDITTFGLPTQVLVVEVALAFIFPPLVALWPILNGTRITVREAISSYGVSAGSFGSGIIDRVAGRIRTLPRPLLLSLRNSVRRKARLGLTLITLTLGGAIFMAVWTVRASALHSIDETVNTWNHNLHLTLNQPYRTDKLKYEALKVPGVVGVENWLVKTGLRKRADGTEGGNLTVTGLPAGTDMFHPLIRQGRWLVPGDMNAIVIDSGILKDERDLTIGSDLVLKIEGRELSFRVVGIIMGQMQGAVAYVDYPAFAQAVRDVGRGNRVVIATAQQGVRFETQMAQTLEQRFKTDGLRVSVTETRGDLRTLTTTHYNVVVVLLLVMAIVLGVVGGLGLMGTMSLNILERTREIGLMRAIGATSRAIRQIVVVEGVLIGLFSWGLGALLAFPLSKRLSDAVGMAMLQVPLSYTFSSVGVVLWLGIVVVLAIAASALPAWNASRLSVSDTLAYE